MHDARRANEIVAAGGSGFEDWDAAAAAEAMARALAVAGDPAGAAAWKARATAALEAITDPEDRAVIEADLATLPVQATSGRRSAASRAGTCMPHAEPAREGVPRGGLPVPRGGLPVPACMERIQAL